MFKALKGEGGMTLMEIMVVLVIIGIIGGVVGKGIYNRYKRAQIKTTVMKVKAIENAVKEYKMDLGSYPESLSDLVERQYLEDEEDLKDPFDCEVQYNKSGAGGKPEVFAFGNEECQLVGEGIRATQKRD